MITDNGIKIQNIYYMLAYAFSVLKQEAYEKLANEEFENAADLLAAILSRGIAIQVKRGLGKEYIPTSEKLSTLRGKIDISQSVKEQSKQKKQLICNYDEFSVNTKMNQIIKTTVTLLLKADIKPEIKKELKNLMMYFKEVDTVNPYTIDWNVRFHRNNQSYQMLINICYLVIRCLIQKDVNGDMKMQKFLDTQRMSSLYEKFILAYYRQHFPELKASASHIPWQLDEESIYIEFLPRMKTDIMLSYGDKTLIIDAKYYSKSMTSSQFGDKKTFHSSNLYQIFAYVKNKDKDNTGNVSGMLLYAKTDEAVTADAEFNMSGNKISIKSLDLGGEFSLIQAQLNAYVAYLK